MRFYSLVKSNAEQFVKERKKLQRQRERTAMLFFLEMSC
jgi:hypothetical protein